MVAALKFDADKLETYTKESDVLLRDLVQSPYFGDPTFRFMLICCLMQPNFVDVCNYVCNYEQYRCLLIRSTIFEQKQINHVFFSIFNKSVSKNDGIIIVHTKISTTMAVEFFRTQQCKSNPNHCSSDSSIILVPAVQPFLS
jgi:hypothetical protein